MTHFISRNVFLTLVAVSVVMGTLGVARNDDPSSRRSEKPVPADHGLLLILSQSQTSEPPDSGGLKTCLADHPPLACVLLTITVENRGRETVLRWASSCGADVSFDMKKSDDSWEPLPNGLPMCSRNILYVQKLSPGERYVEQIRIADSSDTAFPSPDDQFIHPHHQGFELLMSAGPRIIRARWSVDGCVASDKLKPDEVLDPYSAGSLCVAGTEPKQLIVLRSNELKLPVRP